MDGTKTAVALGMGVIAVGGVFFYMKQQKDKSEAEANLRMAQVLADAEADAEASAIMEAQEIAMATPLVPQYTAPSGYGIKVGVQNSRGLGLYKWYAVDSRDRTKFNASAGIGTQAIINGTMPCTFSDFYLDSNGKKGSFRCEEVIEGTYDIPNGSRMEY